MGMLYFIALLGGLILFHEFGHFIVARLCGVRVLVFSLGFGPRWTVFRSKKSGTEYCISALPLGGYVKMLGDDPDERLDPEDSPYAFNNQALWKRFLIVFAGPFFNLVLPLFIFFFVGFTEPKLLPPELGLVMDGGPAAEAGLEPGDRIVSIDGEEIEYWWQMHSIIKGADGEELAVIYEREGERRETVVRPRMYRRTVVRQIDYDEEPAQIRVGIDHLKPIVYVLPGSPAAQAGLQSWDRILTVNGKSLDRWYAVEREIARTEDRLQLQVLRTAGKTREVGGLALGTYDGQVYSVDVKMRGGEDPVRALGIAQSEPFVYSVEDETPASFELDLQPGDELLSFKRSGKQAKAVQRWRYLLESLDEAPSEKWTVKYRRCVANGDLPCEPKEMQGTFTPLEKDYRSEFNTPETRVVFGADNLSEVGTPEQIENDDALAYGLHRAIWDSWDALKINIYAIAGLFRGAVPMDQLGGPIFIGQLAAKTEERGARWFFNIMVMLSINLGLLNLLPIPMLDGGHLMFFAIEAVKRSPVSIRTRQIAAYLGMSIILLLMVLVFKNDLTRLFEMM